MSEAREYRKRPVVITAVQWTGDNAEELKKFMGVVSINFGRVVISTLEGTMHADEGDWIIRGVKGQFYPCNPDIFSATYELVHS